MWQPVDARWLLSPSGTECLLHSKQHDTTSPSVLWFDDKTTTATTPTTTTTTTTTIRKSGNDYAFSYVQERDPQTEEWIYRAVLRDELRACAQRGDRVWLDRLAWHRGFSNKSWAMEGLEPYVRLRVLAIGFTHPSSGTTTAESMVVSATASSGCQPFPETKIQRNSGYSVCLARAGKLVTGAAAKRSVSGGGAVPEVVTLVGQVHLDGRPWACLQAPAENGGSFGVTLMNARNCHLRPVPGAYYLVDHVGLSRAWPVAERCSAQRVHGLYVHARHVPGLILYVSLLLQAAEEIARAPSVSRDEESLAKACYDMACTLRCRVAESGQTVYDIADLRATIPTFARVFSDEVSLDINIMLFWGAEIYNHNDKVAMALGCTNLYGKTWEEKLKMLTTPEKAALRRHGRTHFFLPEELSLHHLSICDSRSRQNGECLRYLTGIPVIFNCQIDQWLAAHGYSESTAAERSSRGWYFDSFVTERLSKASVTNLHQSPFFNLCAYIRVSTWLNIHEDGRCDEDHHQVGVELLAAVTARNKVAHAVHRLLSINGRVISGSVRRGDLIQENGKTRYQDQRNKTHYRSHHSSSVASQEPSPSFGITTIMTEGDRHKIVNVLRECAAIPLTEEEITTRKGALFQGVFRGV